MIGSCCLGQHVQEGRAREDEILFRLTTITSAATSVTEQCLGAVQAYPGVLAKASQDDSKANLQQPAVNLRYTRSHHSMEKLQGLKETSDESTDELKTRKSTREAGKPSGSAQLLSKRQTPVETLLSKAKTGNQSGPAGWQSECDVVIYPGSAVQVLQIDN